MHYTSGVGRPVRPLRCPDVTTPAAEPARVISFDVEEHHRIEAAAGVDVPVGHQRDYAARMERTTLDLLDRLAAANVLATFFVVGDIAEARPRMVRAIHDAGHEIGSHSWDHRRVHHFDPKSFRDDLLRSKDAIEQVTGERVVGFRAPTFSVMRETAWAIDVLAECGFEYDSSIFPVRHDRYGIPDAPRQPFVAVGAEHEILELPPLTYRVAGMNLPVAGGGYFRLFPPAVMRAGLRQAERAEGPNVAMLYFHPWEFDPDQPRLPLARLSRWRTYVGVKKTTERLERLLREYTFRRAIDVVRELRTELLPRHRVVEEKSAGVVPIEYR
jgi:polysaccharide deacetylase family protein (PEP-CTERM system associated)